ncbi:hypothetical protein [Paraclostridium sp. AKS73]|uniref:hypothetical protein n=1 Tax=Paraclostridium sp. AKS73 TaxID=2876116 RepID=UPI002FE6CA91
MDIIKKQNFILSDPSYFVGITAHGASSIDFTVRVWCKAEHYWDIHGSLLEEVKIRFDKEDISIPYPQMDVHIKK